MTLRPDRRVFIAGSIAAILFGGLLVSGLSFWMIAVVLGGCALLVFTVFATVQPGRAFLIFLFVIPLNRTINLAEVGGRNLYLSLPDVLFVVCAFGYFAQRALMRRTSSPAGLPVGWLRQPQLLCLAGLGVFCLASWSLWALHSPEAFWPSLLSMLRLFRFPAYYLLGIQLALPGVRKYWRSLLLSGALAVLLGLLQYTYADGFAALWGAPDEFGWADRLYAGFAGGPNLYAAYLATLFCFMLSLFVLSRRQHFSRLSPFGLLGLLMLMAGSILCLALTLSRSGLLTLMAAVAALLLIIPSARGRGIAILAALLAAALLYQPASLRDRVQAAIEGTPGPAAWEGYDYTVWRRLDLARMGWDEMVRSPWTGRGFRPIAPEIAAGGYLETTLHDMYLDVGVKAGAPALVCFLAFLLFSLRDLYRAGRAATDPWLKAFLYALAASTWGLMVSSFAQENFSDDNLAPLIWALLGVAACLAQWQRAERPAHQRQVHSASGTPAIAAQPIASL